MSQELHLTSGPITLQLLRLALPLLGANVLQQLYNIANSLVVTWCLGEQALAALGVAESVMNLYIYVITGACVGAGVLVAQFYGEGNLPRLRRQLYISAVLIGGSVLAAVALGQLFLPQILGLISTPTDLTGDVSRYLRIILVGMLFTFTYNYLAAALRAIGDTRAALLFLLVFLLGKQHPGLNIQKLRRHHKKFADQIQILFFHMAHIIHILIRDLGDRDIVNIYFIFFD